MARTTQVEKPLDEATKYVVLLQVCACTHTSHHLSCSLCWILGFFFLQRILFFLVVAYYARPLFGSQLCIEANTDGAGKLA